MVDKERGFMGINVVGQENELMGFWDICNVENFLRAYI